jgi:simple sugar transport system permease protein
VVFSKLNPFLALLGGFLFGYFDALAIQLASVAGFGGGIPYQFVRMIPYIATLAVVALAIGRARFPKALGQPYRRE